VLSASEEAMSYLHGGYGAVFASRGACVARQGAGHEEHIPLAPGDAFAKIDRNLLRAEPARASRRRCAKACVSRGAQRRMTIPPLHRDRRDRGQRGGGRQSPLPGPPALQVPHEVFVRHGGGDRAGRALGRERCVLCRGGDRFLIWLMAGYNPPYIRDRPSTSPASPHPHRQHKHRVTIRPTII